ncbi:MAG: peptide chain release factor N(5)-glutamine methyltransferase [Candidatus Rokubacteria bacterium]|nr:peptide chain release factor N(5)-glutamine methyltransferase [Candidatus Rokubacteria bacterium]
MTVAPLPTTGALVRDGLRRLEAAGLSTARQDAEWLLAATLGVERFQLYLDGDHPVDRARVEAYLDLLARRARHEPLQHLLGFEDFLELRLRVTPDVLVPRPETEGLAAWAIELATGSGSPLIADIGTGSGAIAAALSARVPGARVLATDVSLAALAVARANFRHLGLEGRTRLLAGDLLDPIRADGVAAVDLIVANLPYLPTGILPALPAEVSTFEPRLALDGGHDGLVLLRRLIADAPRALRPGGSLFLEVGEDQAGPVASMMAAAGFGAIAARRDLRGVERFISGCVETEPVLASGAGWAIAAPLRPRGAC